MIGFLAGIAAALTYVLTKGSIGDFNAQMLMGFAGAGYVGTDAIEAFIVKFFDKPTANDVNAAPTNPDSLSLNALASSLDMLTSLSQKFPQLLSTKPTLTYDEIINFLKTKLYPPANLKKWKASDPLPKPEPGEDVSDGVLDEIGNFFKTTGLPNWGLSYKDEKTLKSDNYQDLAVSIGQVFEDHGGSYVAT